MTGVCVCVWVCRWQCLDACVSVVCTVHQKGWSRFTNITSPLNPLIILLCVYVFVCVTGMKRKEKGGKLMVITWYYNNHKPNKLQALHKVLSCTSKCLSASIFLKVYLDVALLFWLTWPEPCMFKLRLKGEPSAFNKWHKGSWASVPSYIIIKHIGGKVRGSPKGLEYFVWEAWMSALNLVSIHQDLLKQR